MDIRSKVLEINILVYCMEKRWDFLLLFRSLSNQRSLNGFNCLLCLTITLILKQNTLAFVFWYIFQNILELFFKMFFSRYTCYSFQKSTSFPWNITVKILFLKYFFFKFFLLSPIANSNSIYPPPHTAITQTILKCWPASYNIFCFSPAVDCDVISTLRCLKTDINLIKVLLLSSFQMLVTI